MTPQANYPATATVGPILTTPPVPATLTARARALVEIARNIATLSDGVIMRVDPSNAPLEAGPQAPDPDHLAWCLEEIAQRLEYAAGNLNRTLEVL